MSRKGLYPIFVLMTSALDEFCAIGFGLELMNFYNFQSRKVTPAPVELSAYCYACEAYTHDWNLHKFMYKHIRNDKKVK